MKIYSKFLITGALLAVFACVKEQMPDKIKPFDISTGIPLVNSEVSLFSLEDKVTIVQLGSNGVYEMIIKPGWFNFPIAEEIIKIPETLAKISNIPAIPLASSSNSAFSLPNTVLGIPLDMSESSTFSVSGTSLKRIYFKAGKIESSLFHTLSNNKRVTKFAIIFNTIKKSDGTNALLTLTGSNNFILANSVQTFSSPLNGYYMEINDNSFDITPIVDVEGGPTSGNISISGINFSEVKWSKLEANMGVSDLPFITKGPFGAPEQTIDFFALTPFKSNLSNNDPTKTVPNGLDFYFEGATIKLDIQNGFGLGIDYSISPLRTLRKDGTVLETFTDSQLLGKEMNRASDKGGNIKPVNGFNYSLNVTSIGGSVLNNVFKYGPTKLGYGLNVKTKPTLPANSDFIYDTSRVRAYPTVTIPFKGYFKLYDIEQLADYPVKKSDTVSTFEVGEFKFSAKQGVFGVKLTNNLPVAFKITAYFMKDSLNYVMNTPGDTVKLGPFIVEGASVDANGLTNGEKIFNQNFIFTVEKFRKLNNQCKKIKLIGKPETSKYTPGKQIVQIMPSNKMKIQISLTADINVNQK